MLRKLVVNNQDYDLEVANVSIKTPFGNLLFPASIPIVVEVMPIAESEEKEEILNRLVGDTKEVVPVVNKSVNVPSIQLGSIGLDDRIEEEEEEKFIKSANHPAEKGVLPVDNSSLKGKQRQLSEDELKLLKRMRQDFDVRVIHTSELEVRNYKNLKKNIILQSAIFSQLSDEQLRKGVHLLVLEEQQKVRTDIRNNFLYVETLPRLIFVDVENETQGIGKFQFEETVSVYENPDTLLSTPDNGKDKK